MSDRERVGMVPASGDKVTGHFAAQKAVGISLYLHRDGRKTTFSPETGGYPSMMGNRRSYYTGSIGSAIKLTAHPP